MKIAVGQRWQYVDNSSNFIGQIMLVEPKISKIVVKVVHVYKDSLGQKSLGTVFDSACLQTTESTGVFSDKGNHWSWTYLTNQDAP